MFEIELRTLLEDAGFQNVISFGDVTPASPYIVLRPEKDSLGRGTVFRIFTHRPKKSQYQLNEDIKDIIEALDGSEFEYKPEDYNPLPVVNDDDTLSREITFLIVSKY